MARPEKIRLGEILVQQRLITEEQLSSALVEQKRSGLRLGKWLVEHGALTEDQISLALADQLNIPYVDLKFYNFDPATVALLPEIQARRFRAVALEDRADSVLVGMVDPTDLFAYDEIGRILKRDISLAVVNESVLLQAIDRMYRRTAEITGFARELEKDLGKGYTEFGAALEGTAGLEEAPVVKLLQSVFEDATQVRASDIHIEPQEGKLQIRFRIDGILHLQTEADPKIASALALRLKLMSGMDISEKRLPQDGRFNVRIKQQQVDVRISTMPTQHGESVVMRLLNQGGGILGLEKLGMPPAMLERFRHIIHRPNGLVLVTGPTGSGKTTTLYAALSELNTPENKIITVEDPVEYRLPGINQVQVNDKIDLTFSRVLRSALRQDPDVLLIGEMRDQETAQIGLRAAMTGHMVLSTLHTNDALSTPIRLMDMGIPKYMVAASLQAVLAQRLVRMICASCAEPYELKPSEHAWLKLELGDQVDQHTYRHGRGCSHCNGTGYQGRIGIYEMLEMTGPVVDAINRLDASQFAQAARQHMGEMSLSRHAALRVAQGQTTVFDAMRVCSSTDE